MGKVIISIIGKDRPGIIATVSKALFDMDCNIENFSQTTLQGEFAGILIASCVDGEKSETIQEFLEKSLPDTQLHVHVKNVENSNENLSSQQSDKSSEPYIITTIGPDRKGLVAGITEIIAAHSANVSNFQGLFKGGDDPYGNIMIYQVDVPLTTDRAALIGELKAKAKSLGLDITMQHKEIFKSMSRI